MALKKFYGLSRIFQLEFFGGWTGLIFDIYITKPALVITFLKKDEA
jgi:hypothetical protein